MARWNLVVPHHLPGVWYLEHCYSGLLRSPTPIKHPVLASVHQLWSRSRQVFIESFSGFSISLAARHGASHNSTTTVASQCGFHLHLPRRSCLPQQKLCRLLRRGVSTMLASQSRPRKHPRASRRSEWRARRRPAMHISLTISSRTID